MFEHTFEHSRSQAPGTVRYRPLVHANAQRVAAALRAAGANLAADGVRELSDSARTAQEAADALGVPVTQGADPVVLTARIDGPSATDAAARGLALLAREWTEVAGFSLGQPSLDEVFLALTGHRTAQSTSSEDPA